MQHPDSIDPEGRSKPQAATGTGDAHEDVAQMSYEQARDELVAVVRQLESGDLPLERALELWQRGEILADHCQAWLDGARRRIDEAKERASLGEGDEADAES
jgi:exodeoxyribonuclease VII small subunit